MAVVLKIVQIQSIRFGLTLQLKCRFSEAGLGVAQNSSIHTHPIDYQGFTGRIR